LQHQTVTDEELHYRTPLLVCIEGMCKSSFLCRLCSVSLLYRHAQYGAGQWRRTFLKKCLRNVALGTKSTGLRDEFSFGL